LVIHPYSTDQFLFIISPSYHPPALHAPKLK
jgi:hypothetical protein